MTDTRQQYIESLLWLRIWSREDHEIGPLLGERLDEIADAIEAYVTELEGDSA